MHNIIGFTVADRVQNTLNWCGNLMRLLWSERCAFTTAKCVYITDIAFIFQLSATKTRGLLLAVRGFAVNAAAVTNRAHIAVITTKIGEHDRCVVRLGRCGAISVFIALVLVLGTILSWRLIGFARWLSILIIWYILVVQSACGVNFDNWLHKVLQLVNSRVIRRRSGLLRSLSVRPRCWRFRLSMD